MTGAEAPEPPPAAPSPVVEPPTESLPGWRRNLWLLWSGQLVSVWGDACFHGALPLVIKAMDIPDALKGRALGIVLTFSTLPFLLFAVPFGALVDRLDRRRLMVAADLGRGVVASALAALVVLRPDRFGLLELSALAFVLSTFSTLFLPARDSLIPVLVPAPRLFTANALVQTAQQIGPVIGWAIAGAIVVSFGRAHLFTVDALSYLVSAGLLWTIAVPRRDRRLLPAGQPSAAPALPFRLDLWRGVGDTWRHPGVRALLLMTFLNNLFIMGPAFVAAATLINVEWGLSDSHFVGFEASFAAGMVCGTVVALALKQHVRRSRMLIGALVWDGLTYVAFSTLETYPAALVMIFVHAIGIPLITVSRTALVQEVVAPRYHGRTFALVGLTVSGAMAVSLGLTGYGVDLYGSMPMFLVAGIGGTLTGLWGLALKGLRDLP